MDRNSIKPAFKKNNIPIVLSADNNYAPMLSVVISSMLKNSSNKYNYDILICTKDITTENQERLKSIIKKHKNYNIRFIDFSDRIKGLNLQVSTVFPMEIYFRLFIPYLIEDYNKVIYLDSDIVIPGDISKLWEEKLDDKILGVVRDLGMVASYYSEKKSKKLDRYISDVLKDVNMDNYFNSGMLLIDVIKFKEKFNLEKIINFIASRNDWLYPDQDVLNILFRDDIKCINSKYNCYTETGGIRSIANMRGLVPDELLDEYVEARKNPIMVHYALKEKPWVYSSKMDYELYNIYWDYAFDTPLDVEIVKRKISTCGIDEVAFLLKEKNKNYLSIQKDKNDLYFCYKKENVYKLSEKNVVFETLNINNEEIIIDGYDNVSCNLDFKKFKYFFIINGKKVECEKYERYQKGYQKVPSRVKNPGFSKTIGFRLKYKFKDSDILKFICNYDGVDITREIKVGQFFPILPNNIYQSVRIGKHIIHFNSKENICIEKSSLIKNTIKELKFDFSLLKNRKCKILNIIIRHFALMNRYLKRKPTWIVYDNFLTDDNGIAFYEYLKQKKDKKCKVYFLVQKNDEKYEEMKNQKGVLTDKGRKYKWKSITSDVLVGSVIKPRYRNPFGKSIVYRDLICTRKFVFLQHGVITQDLTKEHNRYEYVPSGFVVSAKDEYDSMFNYPYHYLKNEIWLTGLSRFDKLYNDNKKYITIMPTWRKYLENNSNDTGVVSSFDQSNFYLTYMSVLNNKKLLKAIKEYNYTLCFKPHPMLMKALKYFEKEDINYKILSDYNFRRTFAESSLIVSDYSSAIFDFLYLRKPIIYFHPDREEFFANHVYTAGYLNYEKNGFGEVEYDVDSLVDRIIEYLKTDCKMKEKYEKRVNNFFKYNDKNNCERTYEKIIELGKK